MATSLSPVNPGSLIQSLLLNGLASGSLWFSPDSGSAGQYTLQFNGTSPNFYTLSLNSSTGQLLSAGKTVNFIAASASVAGSGVNIIGAGGTTSPTMPASGSYYIKSNGAALVAGQIQAGELVSLIFDGTGFQFISSGATPLIVAFGDGNDGAQNWTTNQSLTRDWFCTTLNVSSGVTVTMNGYKIFCRGLACVNGATFACNGNPASGPYGGEYTTFGCSTLIGGSGATSTAGAGASTGQYSFVAGGAVSGPGSGGAGTSGAGGTSSYGYQVSNVFQNFIHTLDGLKNLQGTTIYNPSSGIVFPVFAAAGGGAGAGNGGYAGGGGGGGGGSCILALRTISGSFTMEATGGAGSDATVSGTGGGGGGNGGLCGLVTTTPSPSVTTVTTGGAGGAGGGSGGTAGVAGADGESWVLVVP